MRKKRNKLKKAIFDFAHESHTPLTRSNQFAANHAEGTEAAGKILRAFLFFARDFSNLRLAGDYSDDHPAQAPGLPTRARSLRALSRFCAVAESCEPSRFF